MKNKGIKINSTTLVLALLAIFPIIPSYLNVFGVGGTNLFVTLFFLAEIIIFYRGRIKLPDIHFDVFTIGLILWLVFRSISILANKEYTQFVYFLLQTVVLFLTFFHMPANRKNFLLSIKTLVYTSGVLCVFGLAEAVTRINIFNIITGTSAQSSGMIRFGMLRIMSYSAQPIVYGVYLLFCMCLCFYLFQFSSLKKERITLKVIYILLWVNLLLTLSRSVIIFAILSQLVLLYISGTRIFFVRLLQIIVVLLAVCIVASVISSKALEIIKNFAFMNLAIFNDDYSSAISGSFGSNASGVGNRIDLYNWVAKSMDDKWLFGFGPLAKFNYEYIVHSWVYTNINVKESIEVQYLDVLYHYGIVGLLGEIIMYVSILITAIKNVKKASWESKVGFGTVCLILFVSYFLNFFFVNQSSDKGIFYVTIMIFAMYCYNSKFEKS